MRIPIHRIYRAFPELDSFTDKQCEAYVRLARKRGGLGWVFVLLGQILLGLMVLPCGFVGILLALQLVDRIRAPNVIYEMTIAGALIISVSVPLGAILVAGDAWLRRSIRAQLRSTTCRRCVYQLIGLPVRDGAVQCPECGEKFDLAAFAMTPSDFIAPPDGPAQ